MLLYNFGIYSRYEYKDALFLKDKHVSVLYPFIYRGVHKIEK